MDNPVDDAEKYLERCIEIDPFCMEEECIRVCADLAYWSAQFADAQKAYWHAERERKREAARLFLVKREETGGKAPIDAIKAMVEVSPEFQAAYVAEIEAEARKAKLWGDVDAIRTKRDMLVELGATRRKEMELDPLIRERHAQARAQREG